ncbi:MAG: DUF1501 domain-containing protein [Planctomycetaceae bacterium]
MIDFRYLHRRTWISLSCAGTLSSLLPAGWGDEKTPNGEQPASSPRIRSVIWLFLKGGAGHHESFDPKPEGDIDAKGEFSAIDTSIPGVQFGEYLPKFAQLLDQCVLLRGISHNLGDHSLGVKYSLTGNRPSLTIEYPDLGSICNKELSSFEGLPRAIAIPNNLAGPGYLGVEFSPLQVGRPQIGKPFSLRGLSFSSQEKLKTYQRRAGLLKKLDHSFEQPGYSNRSVNGLKRFTEEAEAMLNNPAVAEAFDISHEPEEINNLFGKEDFDAGCLLAVRLVASGVRSVTVTADGWDTHQAHFTSMKNILLPKLDSSVAGLIAALKAKDLWETTAVVIGGEFGRTPKINANAGRDHHARCSATVLAGGMFKSGLVIGASDKNGDVPTGPEIAPPDILTTIYEGLGIDYRRMYQLSSLRSIPLMTEGKPIMDVFA